MLRRSTWFYAVCAATCCGCAQWPGPQGAAALTKVEPAAATPAVASTTTPAPTPIQATAPATTAAATPANAIASQAQAVAAAAAAPAATAEVPDQKALAQALAEIQSLGGLDAAAQQRLVADLQSTPPNLWPALLTQFKAAIAYRERAKERLEEKAAFAERVASDAVKDSKEAKDKVVLAAASVPAKIERETPSADWQRSLTETIAALEKSLDAADTAKDSAKPTADPRQVQLRLLHLLNGQKDQALKPLVGFDAAEQEFWGEQLFALSVFMDRTRSADPAKRASEAAPHLDSAAAKLGQLGALAVRNVTFCTEVTSFGVYKQFEQDEFVPGQQLLLYAEIDNLASQASRQGHRTSLRSSYQIFNARGDLVEEQEFPVTEDLCAQPRRDFFIRYFLNVPAKAYAGRHTLQLTIEDALARKIGQATVSFQVRDAGK